jgi:hypothetical protein
MPKYTITAPLANAISAMEGYNTPGTLARINNNPGNIRTWAGIGRDRLNRGYVVFPSATDGWNALYKLVDDYIDGRYHGGRSPNLVEMFRTYAPAADSNDPDHYARFVASRTGLSLSTPLAVQAGVAGGGGGGSVPVAPGGPVVPPPASYFPIPPAVAGEPLSEPGAGVLEAVDGIPLYVLGAVAVVILVLALY